MTFPHKTRPGGLDSRYPKAKFSASLRGSPRTPGALHPTTRTPEAKAFTP